MSKAKYSTYKTSKTLWQEQIPSHWQETELRILFADNKNKNIGLVEKNLLSLSYGKLKRKDIDNATGLVPASFEGYQIIDEGYIVLRFTDLQNDKKSLRVGYANEKGIITNAYIGLAPKADIHSKYFYYQLHFLDKIKFFYNLGGGVRQSLAFKEFGRETVLIPVKDEQTAIANFLDFKIAKIDRFIRKKKQLIKLLNEQKAAIINQAVTKGLDPNAKIKPSGIEWLGDIPEHWEVRKLKGILSKEKGALKPGPFGSDLKNSDIIPNGIKVYNQRAVIDGNFEITEECISIDKFEALKVFEVLAGDILLTTRGTIGKCWIVPDNFEKGIIHPCIIRLRINNKMVYHQYVKLFIEQANAFQVALKLNSNATTIDVIYGSTLKDVFFIVPPITEQLQIVLHIKKETDKLDKTISTIEKEIALTQEYKTVLIAEAVTGKIDIRDFEIPTSIEVEPYEELEEELSMVAEEEGEYLNL